MKIHDRAACGLFALLVVAAGCSDDATSPADPVDELRDEVRAATSAYQDSQVALAEGFVPVSECVANESGAMGHHYLLESRLDAQVQGAAPELLLYAPGADGTLELVGVEYMVLAPAWDAEHDEVPTLLGVPFADHRAEEARHGLPFPHYDLHFWAWQDNPDGVWSPFNPAVSCSAE